MSTPMRLSQLSLLLQEIIGDAFAFRRFWVVAQVSNHSYYAQKGFHYFIHGLPLLVIDHFGFAHANARAGVQAGDFDLLAVQVGAAHADVLEGEISPFAL